MKRKIITQINLIVVISCIVFSLIISITINEKLKKNIIDTSKIQYEKSLENACNTIDDLMLNVEVLINSFASNANLISSINTLRNSEENQRNKSIREIKTMLFNESKKDSYINSLHLYIPQLELYYSSISYAQEIPPLLFPIDTKKTEELNKYFHLWTYLNNVPGSKENTSGITIFVPVKNFGDDNILGILSGTINVKYFDDILKRYFDITYSIYDYKKNLVCGHDTNNKLSNSNYLYIKYKSRYSKCNFVICNKISTIVKSYRFIKIYFVVTISIIILLFIFFNIILSKLLENQFKIMNSKIRKFGEGELNTRLEEAKYQEWDTIVNTINNMSDNIQHLIQEIYLKNIAQKNAQLKSIQIEINEHFLYNTLDMIHWMARANDTESISIIIQKLSSYFRYNLSSGKECIPFSDIIIIIKDYLKIVSYRFKDKFSVEYDLDKSLNEVEFLKYIFQPLVENSIVHGLEQSIKSSILIKISMNQNKNYYIFSVVDNGKGVSESELNDIRSMLNNKDIKLKDSGYALKNINMQISIYYPGSYMEVNSKKNKFFSICLFIRK